MLYSIFNVNPVDSNAEMKYHLLCVSNAILNSPMCCIVYSMHIQCTQILKWSIIYCVYLMLSWTAQYVPHSIFNVYPVHSNTEEWNSKYHLQCVSNAILNSPMCISFPPLTDTIHTRSPFKGIHCVDIVFFVDKIKCINFLALSPDK